MAKKAEAKCPIEPLGDRVVVVPLEAADKTPGGIILPDNAKEKPRQGRVIAVGSGEVNDAGVLVPPALTPGDEVMYPTHSGSDVEFDGTEYRIMREADVLAKAVR